MFDPEDHLFFAFRNAAKYLEVHPQTLENLVRAQALKVDITLRRLRYFKKTTLDRWKNPEAYSFDEIAQMYGITKRTVHHQFRVKRLVEPDAIRSGQFLYNIETIRDMALVIGWELNQQVSETNIEATSAQTADDFLERL
jgi:hypothetical protein